MPNYAWRIGRLKNSLMVCMAALGLCVIGSGLHAEESDFSERFSMNGYGYLDYIQTDANTYLDASKTPTWGNNFFALVGSAAVTDRLKLWAQLETGTDNRPRFTWAFADYQFNEAVSVHAGTVKMPLGFYNETVDATLTRPSNMAPFIYQYATDLVLDAYNGIGADLHQDIGAGALLLQAYGGNSKDSNPTPGVYDHRLFGGRIVYRTPIEGLRLMFSETRTLVRIVNGQIVDETVSIASIDYVTDRLDLKSEYGQHDFLGAKSSSWYVQAAYELSDEWKPYLRYDTFRQEQGPANDPSSFQRSVIAGVGYAFSPNIVLRTEVLFNHGYALPVLAGEMTAGSGKVNWDMLVASVNFAF